LVHRQRRTIRDDDTVRRRRYGDRIRIEMKGEHGSSLFGAIEQVVRAPTSSASRHPRLVESAAAASGLLQGRARRSCEHGTIGTA
jgi:hypothetical protein